MVRLLFETCSLDISEKDGVRLDKEMHFTSFPQEKLEWINVKVDSTKKKILPAGD